jgi:hypothetical protein
MISRIWLILLDRWSHFMAILALAAVESLRMHRSAIAIQGFTIGLVLAAKTEFQLRIQEVKNEIMDCQAR